MSRMADVERWHQEIAPYPDLEQAVRAGRRLLKPAAAEARCRTRTAETDEHNAKAEAEMQVRWLTAPLSRCPRGHAVSCYGCVHRMPPQPADPAGDVRRLAAEAARLGYKLVCPCGRGFIDADGRCAACDLDHLKL